MNLRQGYLQKSDHLEPGFADVLTYTALDPHKFDLGSRRRSTAIMASIAALSITTSNVSSANSRGRHVHDLHSMFGRSTQCQLFMADIVSSNNIHNIMVAGASYMFAASIATSDHQNFEWLLQNGVS
jgi:hypothetical protein